MNRNHHQRNARAALSLDGLMAQAVQGCHRLEARLRSKSATLDLFFALDEILQALPLARDEYACARCRLTNASGYFALGEIQAAAWEIRLLGKRLHIDKLAVLAAKRREPTA